MDYVLALESTQWVEDLDSAVKEAAYSGAKS